MKSGIKFALSVICAGLFFSATPADARAPYKLTYLTRPTTTHGVHGMKFDKTGHLLVGDVLGFTIWKVDIKSGRVAPFVRPPYGCADDLAFSADGTLAWTSLLTGEVYAQSPDGRRHVVARGLPGVNSIGFAPDGRLYVTQLIKQGKLWQLDLSGRQPPKLILDDVEGLNGFRIDSKNVLWGPRGKRGDILRLDLTSLNQRIVTAGFIWPTGVDIDKDGMLYVVDLTAGSLTRVDPSSGRKTLIKQLDPGIDNLTIGKTGLIYVSNSAENSIYEIDPKTGVKRYVRRGYTGVPGGLSVSSIDGVDTVFYGNTFSFGQIDHQGTVKDLGRRVGAGAIVSATSIRYGQGKLILSHFDEGRVRIANASDGRILRTINGLDEPYDAVLLADGDIVVAEHHSGRIMRVKADDSRSLVTEGLKGPVGLVLEDPQHLVVTEAGRGTLTRVDIETGKTAIVRDGLKRPEGVDRGSDGSFYVAEAGTGVVSSIHPSSGARTVVASGLPLPITPPAPMDPVWIPMGVASGADGDIYVSLDGVGAVAKLTPLRTKRRAAAGAKREKLVASGSLRMGHR